jgi:hypothetical protein
LAAERLGPVDHGVAGIELALLPCPRRLEARPLLLVGQVVEHRDRVRSLAPDLLGRGGVGQRFGGRLQPGSGLLAEAVEVGEERVHPQTLLPGLLAAQIGDGRPHDLGPVRPAGVP